jgi:hypothetical protein
MIENLDDSFDASAAIVLVTWLAVFPSTNAGPLIWLCETNIVPTGNMSMSDRLYAVPGPEFVTVTS